MKEKTTMFWETEKELRKVLLLINAQLEVTQRVLSAQMPKLQELFLQLAQLGTELGYDVDRLGVKKFYDCITNSELFQANETIQGDAGAEKGHDAQQKD